MSCVKSLVTGENTSYCFFNSVNRQDVRHIGLVFSPLLNDFLVGRTLTVFLQSMPLICYWQGELVVSRTAAQEVEGSGRGTD